MNKKMIHIRVLSEIDEWLTAQSGKLGFSKNDYVNMILIATYKHGHIGVPGLLPKEAREQYDNDPMMLDDLRRK